MMLDDLLQIINTLSIEELDTLQAHLQHQREQRLSADRRNLPLNIDELESIFAELREGFTERDLEELEWAMNVE